MPLSTRTDFPSGENALARRRAELEVQGARIIDLTVTNPTACGLSMRDVVLPPVEEYVPTALGSPGAREAVARFIGSTAADSIVLSASTSEAYGWLFKLLADAGDEVLVPAPCYPLLDYLAALEGVSLTRYPLRYDGRWCTDTAVISLENPFTLSRGEARVEGRTRALVAVSPGNPTGSSLDESECEDLGRFCADHGLALIIDEVFAAPEHSLARRAWPCLTFILGGLSKTAGLPQLKLAWTCVRGPGAHDALARLELIADTYLSVGSAVQVALPAILERSGEFRARVAERCAQNRALLTPKDPSWQLLNADAGWCAVLRVPEHPTEEARCLALLDRGVAVHPGFFYDFPFGAHVVLSLLPPPEDFVEGLRRLW